MRSMNDAVLTGIGTVLADDPLLTCRLPGMDERSPVRVVLDTMLRLPPAGRLVADRAAHAALGRGGGGRFARARTGTGCGGHRRAAGAGDRDRLDLGAVLKLLAGRGITRLMVEAGPTVATAFLRADLVDEATVIRSPSAIGADGIDALDGLPLSALTQSPRLKPVGNDALGTDRIETFERE